MEYDNKNLLLKRQYKSKELGEGTETYTYDWESNAISDGRLTGMSMTPSTAMMPFSA